MTRAMLKQYTALVEFLGLTLGPYYEITLHDINGQDSTIAAIVNGSISGRDLESPPTAMARQVISNNADGLDHHTNYRDVAGGKVLRSSTHYIRDPRGNLVGMLCVSFDDSKFQTLATQLIQLIHPDNYVESSIAIRSDILEQEDEDTELFNDSLTSVAHSVIQEVLVEDGIPAERLTQAEKTRIVARLERRGVFRLKGAVEQVSKALHSSPASIYRYLNKVRGESEG